MVKEKQTARPGNARENYTLQNTQIHASKKKLLFIPMKVQLITINSAIPYISGMNSTSGSLKTEKILRKRKGGGKRRRESANEKEKEKKEEKEKKRE